MPAELEVLFCDETNVSRPSGAKFFLYGGLVVGSSQFAAVSDVVAAARNSIGLLPSEPLKFSTRACPARVGAGAWTGAKRQLMTNLAGLTLRLFAVYVHERIARQDEKAHWALDGACVAFQRHLDQTAGRGLVVFDHSKNLQRDDLASITSGTTAVSVFENPLRSIDGVTSGHVETVLGLQAVDVALGSIRYCLENPTHDVSLELFESLDGFEGSLERRPWQVKVAAYRVDYDALAADWDALSKRREARRRGM